MYARHFRAVGLVMGLLVLMAGVWAVAAQEQEMAEALDLSNEPIILELNNRAGGPPTIQPLTDGRIVFKINAAGPVSGAFAGTMSAAVTEVNPSGSAVFQGISVTFSIETDQGTLEGYYAGTIYHPAPDAEIADINGHGLILSVSGAYADLFLADVFVTTQVQFVDGHGVSESGTMTLAAR